MATSLAPWPPRATITRLTSFLHGVGLESAEPRSRAFQAANTDRSFLGFSMRFLFWREEGEYGAEDVSVFSFVLFPMSPSFPSA